MKFGIFLQPLKMLILCYKNATSYKAAYNLMQYGNFLLNIFIRKCYVAKFWTQIFEALQMLRCRTFWIINYVRKLSLFIFLRHIPLSVDKWRHFHGSHDREIHCDCQYNRKSWIQREKMGFSIRWTKINIKMFSLAAQFWPHNVCLHLLCKYSRYTELKHCPKTNPSNKICLLQSEYSQRLNSSKLKNTNAVWNA